MRTPLRSLILLLDRHAVPFCHYSMPSNGKQPAWMPLETLQTAVSFARRKHLVVLGVLGRSPLPAAHSALLKHVEHQMIVPFALSVRMPGAIPAMHARDAAKLGGRRSRAQSVILRVPRRDLPRLASVFNRLKRHFKRVNVRLLDLGAYTDDDFAEYRRQCVKLARIIAAMKWPSEGTECNLLTDRLILGAMHNCGAGVEHVTVAPNGRLYVCPGFYYRNEADAIGTLQDGIQLRNARLLTLEGAPICRACDAYHCRRCLWLNKRLTDEINTPSRQQCVAAHLEREASRRLREKLISKAGRLSAIPPLHYLDPFELVARKPVLSKQPQPR
jgi:CXXX repeat peptide maturase